MENKRIKYTLLLFWMMLTSLFSIAQHPLTDEVVAQFQKNQDSFSALVKMESIMTTDESKESFVQYTYGFLMKECYKKSPSLDIEKKWRDKAITQFQKAKNNHPSFSTLDNITKAEKYIVSTYYNDALIAARTFQNTNENYPYTLFEKFETNLNITGIEQPLPALKSQFYKKLAERHYELWEKSDTLLTHPKTCLELYKKVLVQDPTDCEALHNTAILYYNIGVNKIKTIAIKADIESLIHIQEEALELFRQALPFAQSTFQDCPKTTSQFKALMYIQKSLGNDAEFDRLQMEYKKQFPNE